MDKDLEGAVALARLKEKFNDRVFTVPQLGALMRRECPDDWSDPQIEALFKDADKSGTGFLHFSDLVDFALTDVPVVIASPTLEGLAVAVREHLGSDDEDLVSWDSFCSGDPNTRYRWRQLVGRRVVFLLDTMNQSRLFEQLSLLQALQGFPVPDGADSAAQWKTYASSGRYAWGRAAEITVVMPWYRPCQMEQTSRWNRDGTSWTNSEPDGQWLDAPAAQAFVRLLATLGPPLPGPVPDVALDGHPLEPLWRPPLRLLFLEPHGEAPMRRAAGDLGLEIRVEPLLPHLLGWLTQQPPARSGDLSPGRTFALFPERGIYERYADRVMQILGLTQEHMLWIQNPGNESQIERECRLSFRREQGGLEEDRTCFTIEDHILIMDSFTDSGDALFGAASAVRSLEGGSEDLRVSMIVPHTAACPDTLKALPGRLESLGPKCRYFTTDTVPKSAGALKGHPQVEVISIADVLATLLR